MDNQKWVRRFDELSITGVAKDTIKDMFDMMENPNEIYIPSSSDELTIFLCLVILKLDELEKVVKEKKGETNEKDIDKA